MAQPVSSSTRGPLPGDWNAALADKETSHWIAIAAIAGLLCVVYWNSLTAVASHWSQPEYSHGWLIPVFAAVLLWLRRESFGEVTSRERWMGMGLLVLAMAIRAYGAYNTKFTLDNMSFIPALLGGFVMVGGLRVLWWAGPPILFLVFMYPLPGAVRDRMVRPLQSIATGISEYALSTLGIVCIREGNRLHLEQTEMNVIDACSGLRMLTIFMALAAAIAMILTTRPWWERLIIMASSIPIALAVNAIRITITGLLYNLNVPNKIAQLVFHDLAGWIMMPMAMGLLYLEYQLLTRLFLEEAEDTVPVGYVPRT